MDMFMDSIKRLDNLYLRWKRRICGTYKKMPAGQDNHEQNQEHGHGGTKKAIFSRFGFTNSMAKGIPGRLEVTWDPDPKAGREREGRGGNSGLHPQKTGTLPSHLAKLLQSSP